MIYLTANTISTFTCSPDDLSLLNIISGVTPYYLFEFINQNSLEKYYVIPTQISASTSFRTYQLNIPTGATLNNITGGTIYLPTAQYSYNIYEQIQQYNTSINNVSTKVEIGIAVVVLPVVFNTYYNSNITNQNYIQTN